MALSGIISRDQLASAYGVLFQGPFFEDSICDLSVSAIKKAYRKKMFLSHPDRARILGLDEAFLVERSQEVSRSYEILIDHFKRSCSKKPSSRFRSQNTGFTGFHSPSAGNTPPRENVRSHSTSKNRFSVPDRDMKLGEYMYHQGIIDFNTLVQAINWQKSRRPLLGKIARDMFLLLDADIIAILESRRKNEHFGDCAVRLGFICSVHLRSLLDKQARMTPRIGEFFIEKGILGAEEIEKIVVRLRTHNNDSPSYKSACA